MTAVTGLEQAMTDSLLALLPGSVRDRAGNVTLSLGRGSPRRLVSCPLDEVGYVVGNITPEGFLLLRRVGARLVYQLFDQQLEGHRVTVFGARGAVPGVVAVRSTHLTRGRPTGLDPVFTVDNAYLDVGATSAAEARALGIDILTPVALAKRPLPYGDRWLAAPAAGRRAACAALASAIQGKPRVKGTVVAAFTVQSLYAANAGAGTVQALLGPFDDAKTATLPTRYPDTAVETVSLAAADSLRRELLQWMASDGRTVGLSDGSTMPATGALSDRPTVRRSDDSDPRISEVQSVLSQLVESYGVSGAEGPVRETVKHLLPAWAQTETDTAGNLWVRVGRGDPVVVFVAHLDEIGFRITGIRDDGSLELESRGGFIHSLFEAKPALVHTDKGDVAGVFIPRDSGYSRHTPPPLRVDIGTTSRAATAARGVGPGQTITMPKQFVRLAGTRATGRSFDDRVGSAAQLLALRRLDRAALKHQVIFVWSTREEIGLEGAAAVAASLGTTPRRVHAIDTFVSADSPLELPNFAVAKLGEGAVARALDNSSVTPPAYVDSLVAVARARGAKLQVGTTNGGNDGSVFTPYGVVDVAIGWPLRYSHSPAEVVDLRDVASLADLIQAIAETW